MSDLDRNPIVMFSAEGAPFVKVGGLADVVGALPKVLEGLGAPVIIVLPAYRTIAREKFGLRPAGAELAFAVRLGAASVPVEVWQGSVPGTAIQAYFLGGGGYFDRDGVYDDPETKEGYPDNMERFAFFAKAGLELVRRLEPAPRAIHCHDSQTGLIPGLLRTVYRDDPRLAGIGSLFTIHNLAYQGLYDPEILAWSGIDGSHFYPTSPFEFWGKVNFMKVGIEMADLISTVSQTYAREIQSGAEFGYGLEGILKRRAGDLFGIVNGIELEVWNPETDALIPANFSTADLSGKPVCKSALLRTMGLPQRKGRVPLIGIISRLADQKGFDLIGEAMEQIAAQDLQMVVLGTGQPKYHELFQQFASRYPDKIAVRLAFDNGLAHQIEAGADMFLMPSKYEPCGLNQLYSLRYGTIPIVRATGGLADTISDYDIERDRGTGFAFKNYAAADMMAAIERALIIFADSERWRRLMIRAMEQDWSWEGSARQYLKLYRQLNQKRGGGERP